MADLAVLGTGLLGSAMAENLLARGHRLRVWNRTRDRLEPLVGRGAAAADDPAAAVRGADRVHVVLSEDAAVDAVLAEARPGLREGVPVIDHSTTQPAATAARFAQQRRAGVRFVHAPVFMSPQNARDATGLMLLAAPARDAEALAAPLGEMTGKVWHVGERPDLAAFHKLAGNGLILALCGVLGDLLAMGRGAGLAPQEVLSLFEVFRPGAAISAFGQRVAAAGEEPPGFQLAMARKDVRLMLETAGAAELAVLPAVAAAMDRALAEGRGGQDFAVFARDDRG